MPEPQAIAGFGEYAGGPGLINGRDQARHTAPQHDREVRHREVHSEQGCRPQHLMHRPGNKAQAVRDGRRQGARRSGVRQLGGSRAVNGHARAPGQRADQLGDIQRVAGRPFGQLQQLLIGPAAGQGRDQVRYRGLGQPGELQPCVVVHRPLQGQQIIPLRHRAHHPDQQQRHLPHRPGQPPPQRDAGRIRPLEVVHNQDRRPRGALLSDQRQQLLRQRRGHVRATISDTFAAQEPDDCVPPRVRRRVVDA